MREPAVTLIERAAALALLGVPLDLAVRLADLHVSLDDIARARRDPAHVLRLMVTDPDRPKHGAGR